VISALQAIKEYNNKEALIGFLGYYNNGTGYGNLNNNKNNNNSSKFSTEYYIQTYHEPLIEVCDMLYDKILKTVQNQILPFPPE
jgi:hypothetical protein